MMKRIIRFSIITAIIIPVLMSLIGLVYNNISFNRLINALEPQGEMPCYVRYDTIYDGDIEIDLSDGWNPYGCLEVLTKYQDEYYFVYARYDSDYPDNCLYWGIATVDISKQVSVVFEAEFYSHIKDSNRGYLSNNHLLPIEQRNGFYFDGCIYLTDFKKVIKYDIHKESSEEIQYTQFDYPQEIIAEKNKSGEVIITNLKDDSIKTLTFDVLANENNEIGKILKMRSFEIWNDNYSVSKLAEFVQVFGNKIYIFTPILNYNGSTYVAVTEYDQSNQTSKFLGNKYMGDVISGDFYLVETDNG